MRKFLILTPLFFLCLWTTNSLGTLTVWDDSPQKSEESSSETSPPPTPEHRDIENNPSHSQNLRVFQDQAKERWAKIKEMQKRIEGTDPELMRQTLIQSLPDGALRSFLESHPEGVDRMISVLKNGESVDAVIRILENGKGWMRFSLFFGLSLILSFFLGAKQMNGGIGSRIARRIGLSLGMWALRAGVFYFLFQKDLDVLIKTL